MRMRIAYSILLVASVWTLPGRSQDFSKFAFDIGGGMSTPLNPTAQYIGLGGNFVTGAGYNIDKHNSILGEFMWTGMPTNFDVLRPPTAPFGKINLYTLTANYRFSVNKLGHSPFGVYFIGGGGWYYRHVSINQDYVVPDATVCAPIYDWWGYACGPGNYVYTATLASKGVSAPGVNAGVGFTVRLTDSGLKFYVESRYHYAFSDIPSTFVPVTFGFRFN